MALPDHAMCEVWIVAIGLQGEQMCAVRRVASFAE